MLRNRLHLVRVDSQGILRFRATGSNQPMSAEQLALFPPIQRRHDPPNLPLVNRIIPRRHRRQEQNRLLDIRRQIHQVHDLRQPGAGHVPQPGQVGVVANLSVEDQSSRNRGLASRDRWLLRGSVSGRINRNRRERRGSELPRHRKPRFACCRLRENARSEVTNATPVSGTHSSMMKLLA